MRQPQPPATPRTLRLGAALLAATLVLAGCGTTVVNPVTGQAERTVMDEQSEIAQGQAAHRQVLAEYGAYDNPRLQGYVSALGDKLALQSHRAALAWTFTVLDSPEVNAFALPGGHVYVTRGILAYLDSEAELAGVIGHEIGHVTARHGAQRATRAQRAGIGVVAATVLGAVLETAGFGGATQLAGQVSQNMAAGWVASYSREQELQADQLGAEYLARSHYDPQNMVDVIAVLKRQERYAADRAKAEGQSAPSGGGWLASHPSNDQRLADIRATAQRYATAGTGPYADDGRARFLQAVDGLTFGDSPAQGVVRGQRFLHPGLDIALQAPTGWQLRNQREAVLVVNAAGDAGLVLRSVPASAGSSHDEVIRKLLQPSEGRSEPVTLNGLSATRFTGVRRNAQGQSQAVRATVVSGPGGQLFVLQQLARDAAAQQRAATGLAEAEASFRALTAADRQAAAPWRVVLRPLPAGGFAELARHSPLPAPAEAQLRLLNGVYGDGTEPKPGQLVKVIQ